MYAELPVHHLVQAERGSVRLLRKLNRKVRRLLFKPTNWHVLPGAIAFRHPIWWVESRSRAGHFQSGPFYSLDDAIAYCKKMNGVA